MTVVNGRKIQDEVKATLKEKVRTLGHTPTLALVYAGHDPVIETFIEIKQRFGADMGVNVDIIRLSATVDVAELERQVSQIGADKAVDGIVVQLPLPSRIDRLQVLNAVPAEKDPDLLSAVAYTQFKSGESDLLPPVVGAVAEIFARHGVELRSKHVVVVGKGRLVGTPVADWLRLRGTEPTILDEDDGLAKHIHKADIVISGAGDPHIITPEMVKDGVVLIDAGTSDSEGGVRGDIHPDCADKAAVFSPVPGGVGPLTIAKLFENLVILSK